MARKFFLAAMIAFLLAGLWSCGGKDKEMGPDIIARINGDDITNLDLQRAWGAMSDGEKQQFTGPQGLQNLLNQLVLWKYMAQRAREKELDQDKAIQAAVKAYEERLLVNALLDQSISEQDIYDHYQKNFSRAYFIIVRVPPGASEARKSLASQKARELYARVAAAAAEDAPKVFESIMNELSGDTANYVVGHTGYADHTRVEEKDGFLAAEALFGLRQPGQFSAPVEGKNGFIMFMVVEPPGQLNPSGRSPDVSDWLREQKREEVIRSYDNEFRTRNDVELVVNDQALSDLVEQLKPAWEEMDKAKTGVTPADGSTAAAPAPAAGGTAAPAPGGGG